MSKIFWKSEINQSCEIKRRCLRFIWIWKFYWSIFWTKSQFFFSSFLTSESSAVSNALSLSLSLLSLCLRLKRSFLFFLWLICECKFEFWFPMFLIRYKICIKKRDVFFRKRNIFSFDSFMVFCNLRFLLCFVDEKN